MHAMIIVFPPLRRDWQWKMRMAAVQSELKPTTDELADVMIEARKISERLNAELVAD